VSADPDRTTYEDTSVDSIARVPATHEHARRLIEAVQAEYVVRYGSIDATPIDAAAFEDPHGAFFVAYRDGEPVATGAWRRRDDVEAFGTRVTAEVKRMYVVPAARGSGVARRMLGHLEAAAAAAGLAVMVLETGTEQPEAMALYESAGYSRIEPFGHYRESPLNRCYAKQLAHQPAQS
jgi:GNAT superfamily N-acetyltransferase